MANRTRAKRAALKRRALQRVTETQGDQPPVSTDTTEQQETGVRGLLEDPRRIRSDLALLTKYMGCAQFTEDEIAAMVRRVGSIVAESPDDRIRVSAFKTLLAQAKLSFDMDRGMRSPETQRHVHGHLHVENRSDSGATDVFGIARSLGLQVDIVGDREPDASELPGSGEAAVPERQQREE